MGAEMNEWIRTGGLGAIAGVIVLLAVLTAPSIVNPDLFSAEGEEFYPAFSRPLDVKSLEVTTFQSNKGSSKSFKVAFDNGKWIIPSHHDYPADAEERMKKTSSALLGLKKDVLYSARTEDHESFQVLDPLDPAVAGGGGYGKRVSLYDDSGNLLADYVLGKEVPNKEKKQISTEIKVKDLETGKTKTETSTLELTMRYVRVPGRKRTYGVWTSADVSSRFSDWINTDLLQVEKEDVRQLTLNPYKIKERSLSIDLSTGNIKDESEITDWDPFALTKVGEEKWGIDGTEVEQDPVTAMLSTLDELLIVGVRRKPLSLTRDLEVDEGIRLDQRTRMNLRGLGFFVLPIGEGKGEILVSNEGELEVATDEGVIYSLRFGEIIYGEGDAVTAGGEKNEDGKEKEGRENRYVFIMARFDVSLVPPPAPSEKPAATDLRENDPRLDFDARRALREERERKLQEWQKTNDADMERKRREWEKKVTRGKERAKELNDRFAAWYYVISGDSFKKLHQTRETLLKK